MQSFQLNKVARLVVLGVSMLATGAVVHAADAAKTDAPKNRIAVIDLQRAVMMTTTAQEQIKALQSQKDYTETAKKAESLRQQLVKNQEELQKEGPSWTPEQRDSHLKEMDFLRKDFELAAQKIQSQNQELMHSIGKDMEPKVKQVLQQLIEADGISLVVDKAATIYTNSEIDITDKVIEKLNQLK
jgi:outer membrane protein